VAENSITIFRNIHEVTTPFYISVQKALDRIKDGSSKDLVKKIRGEKNKKDRNELKKGLPSICFSGKFSKREDGYLIEHSGILCLDFDGYRDQKDLLRDKEVLSKDKFVYAVFISPSGDGLKALVRIPPDPDNHVNYFNSIERHFNSPFFDKTAKNLSRVCYESYDPLIHVNDKSSVWDKVEDREYVEVDKVRDRPTIPITDESKIVDILLKWWERKFPMAEGQRNENTFILAAALNDFGVNKALAGHILRQYASESFDVNEINRTIESAYRDQSKFGTKYYEDDERISSIKARLKRGVPKKEVLSQMHKDGIEADTAEAVIERIEAESLKQVFWTKSDKGVVKIVHILFKQFLEDSGFYKYRPEDGKSYVFVKVVNNLINHASEDEIKDFVLQHLLELDDSSVYNYFADNTRFFKEDFLSMINTIHVYLIRDTRDTAYLYFRNCAVRVRKDSITTIDYIDLGGYVWKDHVIDRNFSVKEVGEKCDYRKFIHNVCNNDKQRIKSMESTIGYLLHGFRDMSKCPAVILNDEVISDNPEGGTGKGLFMNALSSMKKVVKIDGKMLSFERFSYQLVSADTQILCFDDVKKHFEFERLFSVITEGLTLEKKNMDAIKIPFERSPKVAITTNYALRGSGNSHDRRKWELELHRYYSKKFSPYDEFGKMMFGDWNDEEWLDFDNYMIGSLKSYLSTGLKESKFVNLNVRQLSADTCHEFIEWCGLIDKLERDHVLKTEVRLYKNELYDSFIDEYPDYGPRAKMSISRTRFYKWLESYAMYLTGQMPEDGRDQNGRWMIMHTKDNADGLN